MGFSMAREYANLAVLLALSVLLAGCSSNRILQEPGASKVKSVAVVSVSSQRTLLNSAGGGALIETQATEGLSGDASTQQAIKLQRFAVSRFEQELGRAPGWKLVPLDTAARSPGYAKMMQPVRDMARDAYRNHAQFNVAPDGVMLTAKVGEDDDWNDVLAQVAKELGVDAVFVLEVDLTYRPNSITGMSTSASAQIATSITAVDSGGRYLANTKGVDITKYRCKSTAQGKLLGRYLASAGEADKIFQEALNECIGKIGADIRQDRSRR
jgi:hypothetical protein